MTYIKYYSLLFLILLTSCSKNSFTNQLPKKTITFSVTNNTPSLIFFSPTSDQNEEHKKIYLRFRSAFGDSHEFPIKTISTNEIVEYLNDTTVYYNNKSSKQQGLILSNGKKTPIIEYNPKNYIKAYENYFGITFNDKINHQEKAKNVNITNKELIKEILERKFKITEAYAKSLIKNSGPSHYSTIKKKKTICNTGTVYTYHYSDTLKTKKPDLITSTKYKKNNQYEKEIIKSSTDYKEETNFYYNNFGLIDSITRTKTSQGKIEKSKSFYIYRKNEYFILDKENNTTFLSLRYILNDKLQCTNQHNFSRYSTEYKETEYKYDSFGRLSESLHDGNRDVYQYEKSESEIYSVCLHYSGDKLEDSKNIIYKKDNFLYYLTESKNKNMLYSKAKIDKNECTNKIYNYDVNNEIIGYTEFIYE